jgi:hypothetical protein
MMPDTLAHWTDYAWPRKRSRVAFESLAALDPSTARGSTMGTFTYLVWGAESRRHNGWPVDAATRSHLRS